MKNKLLLLLSSLSLLAGSQILFVGCGSSSSSTPAVATSTVAGSCSAGYVYTATYGCLTQGSCPSGYGDYNGQCVVGSSGSCTAGYVYTQYGCLTQGSCPSGYGSYNGQCVVATSGSGYGYGYGYGTTGTGSGYPYCPAGYTYVASANMCYLTSALY
jgi:hypothetical protein